MARLAMDAWSVVSHQSHLRRRPGRPPRSAFDETTAAHVPRLIFKIGWTNIAEMRQVIRQNIDPLALTHMDIGQLCLLGRRADRAVPHRWSVLRRFPPLAQGRGWFAASCWRSSPGPPPSLWKHCGRVTPVAWSTDTSSISIPLQRFAANDLWDLIQQRGEPMVAMNRTVAGGNVHRLRDVPAPPGRNYLASGPSKLPRFPALRLQILAGILRSFCLRFPECSRHRWLHQPGRDSRPIPRRRPRHQAARPRISGRNHPIAAPLVRRRGYSRRAVVDVGPRQ